MEAANNETMNTGPGDQGINPDNIPQDHGTFSMDNSAANFTYENLESITPLRVTPWATDFNTCHTIENLDATSNFELNQDIQRIIDIHQDMVSLLTDRFKLKLIKKKMKNY